MTSDGMHPDPGASASMSMGMEASLVGEVLDGRYRIVKKLGEGGMGEVYAAEHVHIEKRVAVKLLRPEIVTNKEAVNRFKQEARSASSIGHKNIIGIEDFGQLADGRIYLCMELLNGAPLNDMIKEPGGLPLDRLLNILIQTGHGLAAAHAKGIVHRDMKPENIFVTHGQGGEDVPKLLDFGIAKVAGNDGQNNLTKTGTIFGTPFYMAPEQALGQQVDARADVYAMGVICYEVFSGSLPFRGESFMGILTQHITTEPEPVSQRAAAAGRVLPPGLEQVIQKAMAKDPERRYQSMDELVQALVGVYRIVAGQGMSAYMEAYRPPPTGLHGAAQMPTVAASLPQGYPPPPPPPGGSAVFAPVAASDSFVMPARKSKAGMIFAIVAILAVVGGGVALFLVSQSKKDKADDGGDVVASVVPDAGAAVVTPVDAAVPVKVEAPDAAPAKVETPDAAPAKVEPIKVLVDANADGAKIFENGKQIGKAPEIVDVRPGETRTLVLKHPKYKDATVTIDGSSDEVKVKLDRKGSDRPDKPDKPDKPEDPKAKFCREHPDDIRCMIQ